MPQGKVKWFSTEKAYGFIAQDNDNDIFVHVTGLAEGVTSLETDQLVEFEVTQGRKGDQAANVRPVTAAAAPTPEAETDEEPVAEEAEEAEEAPEAEEAEEAPEAEEAEEAEEAPEAEEAEEADEAPEAEEAEEAPEAEEVEEAPEAEQAEEADDSPDSAE